MKLFERGELLLLFRALPRQKPQRKGLREKKADGRPPQTLGQKVGCQWVSVVPSMLPCDDDKRPEKARR